MEVRIGIQEAARELTLESTETPDTVAKKVAAAIKAGGLLDLVDERGHRVVVPAEKIAFVEIAAAEPRKVGFATD